MPEFSFIDLIEPCPINDPDGLGKARRASALHEILSVTNPNENLQLPQGKGPVRLSGGSFRCRAVQKAFDLCKL